MNKCIIFALFALVASVAAGGQLGYNYGSPAVYGAKLYAQPIASLHKPAAAAAASAANSAPSAGYVHAVPSYTILGGNDGYSSNYGYNPY